MPKPKKERVATTDTGERIRVYERARTGRLIPCPGQAHSNPFIDNCGVCMPRWGEIDELAPVAARSRST